MRIANICICDENELYTQSVQKYLLKRQLNQMKVLVFNSVEKVLEYSKREPFDLVLINERLLSETVSMIHTKKTWVLLESKKQHDSYPGISKFQSMEKLLDQVLEEIPELVENEAFVKKAKLLFFFETQSTGDKTKGFTVSSLIANADKKVLYLNLSPFTTFSFLTESQGADVTDLFYYLLKESHAVARKIDLLKKEKNQVHLFLPAFSFQDLAELTKQQWNVILQRLVEDTDYDFIVVESNCTNQGLFEIYDTCVNCYMSVQDQGAKQFQKMLEQREESVTSKLCFYESMDLDDWKGLLQKDGHIKAAKQL